MQLVWGYPLAIEFIGPSRPVFSCATKNRNFVRDSRPRDPNSPTFAGEFFILAIVAGGRFVVKWPAWMHTRIGAWQWTYFPDSISRSARPSRT